MKLLKRKFSAVAALILALIMAFSVAACDISTIYTVRFVVDGETYETQTYEEGQPLKAPEKGNPEKENYTFTEWNTEEDGNGTSFEEGIEVNSNLTFYAIFEKKSTTNPDDDNEHDDEKDPAVNPDEIVRASSFNESLYVEWKENYPAQTQVEYKAVNEKEWKTVDSPLIRATSATEARVDIVGLSAGTYNVKITTAGKELNLIPIPVTAYDRSGYAHFGYSEGVGAYKDDGTIKDGTLVIYVTEENKNDILDYAYLNGQKVNISQYMVATQAAMGVTVGQQTGIGELLNNRRYSGNDRMNVGIAKLCQVYGSVAIRIIGTVSAEDPTNCKVSTIRGLTDYAKSGDPHAYPELDNDGKYGKGDTVGNGGSVGDNGRMARITNAKNLTIEGIGDDATIFGWGVHFISSDVLGNYPGVGKGFEVRNLTFENYPEDAIGMEGIQGDKWDSNGSITSGASSVNADLPSSVERCWIHNNTFLPGHCTDPAESDKGEGDGSCDFKRGMYYTLSYNYFTDCHKTNLIGSSDSSLQFNITMHHNWWNNCGSRMPLVRNANVHFYNNYFSGDMTRDPKPALSYVTSARANSYMFSENNYFEGAKQVVLLQSGGQVKSYGDMFYATFGTYSGTIVSDRDQSVPNNCKFTKRNIDFSNFDTDSTLFYYKDGQSKCLLDDPVTARANAMMYAGANGKGVGDKAMNTYTPDGVIQVSENGVNIIVGTNQSGIVFNGVKSGKFKGQGITFTLSAQASLTVTTTTSGDSAPELIGADGRVYAHKFEGTLTIVLEAGTYVIASGQKDKEAVITEMKFENTAASSSARIQAAHDAIENLSAIAELTETYATALRTAQNAYNALTSSEKTQFTNAYPALIAKLNNAITAYSGLQVEYVRGLIQAIGAVNENSYSAIKAAQDAYDGLSANQKAQLVNEKATLDAAWAAYESFAVQNVIKLINTFVEKISAVNENTDRAAVESLIDEGEAIQTAFDNLSNDSDDVESQQSQVTNYSEFTAAMAKLENVNGLFVFRDQLEYFKDHTVTMNDAGAVNALQAAYNALTSTQKSMLTSVEKELYESVLTTFDRLQSALISSNFLGGKPSNELFRHTGSKQNQKSAKFFVSAANEEFTTGLKFEKDTELTLTITGGAKVLKLYFNSDKATKSIMLDGVEYACVAEGNDPYVVTVTLEAGEHKITRASYEMWLYYATLAPAA